jgi:hypothetical protein
MPDVWIVQHRFQLTNNFEYVEWDKTYAILITSILFYSNKKLKHVKMKLICHISQLYNTAFHKLMSSNVLRWNWKCGILCGSLTTIFKKKLKHIKMKLKCQLQTVPRFSSNLQFWTCHDIYFFLINLKTIVQKQR